MFLACSTGPEAGVMRVLLGVLFGMLLMWLYQSKRVREEAERGFAAAPESWRHAATSAKDVSASQIGRVAHAVEAVPVRQPLMDALSRASMAVRSTAEKPVDTPDENHAETIPVQQGADGA
jgi:hypothetical protein